MSTYFFLGLQRSVRMSLALVFFLPSFVFGSTIQSLSDFYVHTDNHVKNVGVLMLRGLELIAQEKNPAVLKALGLPLHPDWSFLREKVLEYAAIHDEAKRNMGQDFLQRYKRQIPVLEELYQNFGTPRKRESNSLVNPIDDDVSRRYFQSQGWSEASPIAQFLEKLEEYADQIERGKNPMTKQEMGRTTYLKSSNMQYHMQVGVNQVNKPAKLYELKLLLPWVQKLEADYAHIATGYDQAKELWVKKIEQLKQAGMSLERLHPLAPYYLIQTYERSVNQSLALDESDLPHKLRQFFQNTPVGQEAMESMLLGVDKNKPIAWTQPSPKQGDLGNVIVPCQIGRSKP